jgi:hypothetical protein
VAPTNVSSVALSIVITLLWTAVGLLIFWRCLDDWMALLASLTLVLYNPGQQDQALTALALAHPAWTVPVEVVTFLGEAPIVFLLLLFPSGRFEPRWTRWLVPLALAQTAYSIFLPATVVTASGWLSALDGLLFIGFLLLVIFSQIHRYRRISTATQRQQIKWVVFGIILTAGLLVGLSAVYLIPGLYQPGSLTELVVNTLYPLAALPLPLSIGIAVLRYRLWDIDTVINKALVYGLLTALLAGLYASLIIGLEGLAGLFVRQAASNPLVLVVSTLVIVTLFGPLRRRIQTGIDRRFYRRKYDAQKTLARFGATLRQEVDLTELQGHLIAVVQETMQPAHVSLWLRPTDKHESEALPMTHRGGAQ